MVFLAEVAASAASATFHGIARNINWRLVGPLAISVVLGGAMGASLLATGLGG